MHNRPDVKIFTIEGNIGAGKSTFLKILNQNLSINAVFEPLKEWQHISDSSNLLALFYQDTKRWAYTFQSYAFISRIKTQLDNLKNCKENSVQILERSVYCDRHCFAKNCFEQKTLSEVEWNIYKEWFDWLVETYVPAPSGFIYLQTDPKTCYKRLKKRNRTEEKEIPLAYLSLLHQKHEEWLLHKKEVIPALKNTPVLVLDCDQEFEKNGKYLDTLLKKTQNFIDECKVTPSAIIAKAMERAHLSQHR